MTAERERIVSKPVFRQHRERSRAYVDWTAGEGISERGEALTTTPQAPLSRLLKDLPRDVEQVFICGGRPGEAGGVFGWLKEPSTWREWEGTGTHPDNEGFVIRLKHRATGRRVALYSANAWFGPDASPREARAAFSALGELLKSRFHGDGVTVLPTPAQTGLDLWDRRRSLEDHPSEHPVLPEEIRNLIRSTSTQHREEPGLGTRAGLKMVPSFFYFDARFGYAAFSTRMPVGEPQVDELQERDRYRPGRYLIRFRVPERWGHIGYFPAKIEDQDGGKEWHYPGSEAAGETFETWVDHAELLAMEELAKHRGPAHEWDYEILSRILFEVPGEKGAPPDPLETWAKHLIELREEATNAGIRGELSGQISPLVSGALRNILLHTVGAFHGSRRERIHHVPMADLANIPPELIHTVRIEGPVATYRKPEAASRERLLHAHPEWSSTVWAKTRARMLFSKRFGQGETGALTVPREDVLAIRGDALYLARDPDWPETGRVGELRKKGEILQPVEAPDSGHALNPLRDRSERELRERR